MAKGLQSPAWRRPRSESTLETVRELRNARPRPRWTRVLGVLLMVVAAAAAFDPDYPLPRAVLQSIADSRVSSEGIVAVEPRGQLAAVPEVFRWSWAAGSEDGVRTWNLVLLDADARELARIEVEGCEARVQGRLRDAIESADEFHWHVESSAHKGRFRSAPAAFAISR